MLLVILILIFFLFLYRKNYYSDVNLNSFKFFTKGSNDKIIHERLEKKIDTLSTISEFQDKTEKLEARLFKTSQELLSELNILVDDYILKKTMNETIF